MHSPRDPRIVSMLVLALGLGAIPALAAPSQAPRIRPRVTDIERRIDANRVNMFVSNSGSLAFDGATGSSGFIFPRGGNRAALFAAGLWIGAESGCTVAEYSTEYVPGLLIGGVSDDPNRPEYRVYKVRRWTGDPADSAHVDRTPAELAADPSLDPLAHHSWSEYLNGAAPFGAPTRFYRLDDTSTPAPGDSVDVLGPDVSGDQMLWCVYNDGRLSEHSNRAGGTAPLGVEVRQTAYAFESPGSLENTVFVRFQIANRGSQSLSGTRVSIWVDPDVGGATDDLTACDPQRSFAYAFNGQPIDAIYGAQSPAVGIDLLRGPLDAGSGARRGLTAFAVYVNGGDFQSHTESYNVMQGLSRAGTPVIDPTTGLPTAFVFASDPPTGGGWLDPTPSDKRMLMSAGPFTMAPGDSQDIVIAIIAGQCAGNVESIRELEIQDDAVQAAWDQGLPGSPSTRAACAPVSNCLRTAAYWASQCPAGGANIGAADLQRIAEFVNTQSSVFDWTPGSEANQFCATLSPPADARAAAKRELAAILANLGASRLGIVPQADLPIALEPLTPVACASLDAHTLGELVMPAELTTRFTGAEYLDDVPAHGVPLEGIGIALPSFGGGAGSAREFIKSDLGIATDPDSFVTVEIRFSTTVTQKAYRFLRVERASDGGNPNTPFDRPYLYAGYFDVPFTLWDVDHNEQLDAAFAERVLTADDGTILPIDQQPATFDSTWSPDESTNGGREYLWAIRRPYSPTPKNELAFDDVVSAGFAPLLWALAARRTPGGVIDDGDRFRWNWTRPMTESADMMIMMLEDQPLTDPGVQQVLQDIASCVAAIDRGEGIGPVCDRSTAVLVSLVSAVAMSDRVELEWSATGARGLTATVWRRAAGEPWRELGTVDADGDGRIVFSDVHVIAGARYRYRIVGHVGGADVFDSETSIEIPSATRLALAGSRPNPSARGLTVQLSLPDASPARLEVLDLAGRRVLSRDVGALGPGSHVVSLAGREVLAPGVYLLRLRHGGEALESRAVIIR